MMSLLKSRVWPIIAGLVIASIVMLAFEYVNSFIFPIPNDLDWKNPEAVRALTASLPWTAYILVLLGWIAGSFAGGYIATYLSADTHYCTSFALGIILTVAGIYNVTLLGHPIIFTIISIPMFIIFTYVGYLCAHYTCSTSSTEAARI